MKTKNRKNKWLSLVSLMCVMVLLLSSCMPQSGKKEETQKGAETGKPVEKDPSKEKPKETQKQPEKVEKPQSNFNEKDIKKVSMDNIINKDLFSGFTDKQLEMLEKNGFVILPPNFDGTYYRKMHQGYEHLDYGNASVMITTDAVLHLWHIFFSESMKAMELKAYTSNLQEITRELYTEIFENYDRAPRELKKAYENVLAYFAVANHLYETADNISYDKAPKEVKDIVTEELQKIEEQSLSKSVLLGRDIDYSQFKVRGHYTQSPELTKYFKVMMWYGYMGFDIMEQTKEAVIITDTLLRNRGLRQMWEKNYELTSLYSGESDDISIHEMEKFLKDYDSKNLLAEISKENTLAKLTKAMDEKLPMPRIVPDLSEDNKGMKVDRSFKFMGQRFSSDAYIMQNLMKAIDRPLPNTFEIFGAMGNETAEKYARENYMTNQDWPEYDTRYEKMKKEYQSGELTKGDNLYNGWTRAIEKNLNYIPKGSHIPYFMTTPAYEYKKINTALGSFAELKHDNILYSKQAMAEMGGPDGQITYHFLEPNVEMYEELYRLSKRAEDILKGDGLEDELLKPLREMKEILEDFVEISKKELNGQDLDAEEMRVLTYYGGLVDYISTHYVYQLLTEGYEIDTKETSALVADIATILPNSASSGGYLEVATGIPQEIYVLCHLNGVDFIAQGFVYSAFEFLSQERLTDEEWHKTIGFSKGSAGEYSFTEFDSGVYRKATEPLAMKYMQEISTGEENKTVQDNELEVNWPALKE